MSQLDAIDTTAARAFEGYVVRKDLVRRFKGQYPVPTYVAEFLLGRYCASVDEDEIAADRGRRNGGHAAMMSQACLFVKMPL